MLKKSFDSSSSDIFGRISLGGLLMLLACFAFTGCSSQRKVDPRVTPLALARSALETSLKAWQSNQSQENLEVPSHQIKVIDSVWSSGAKLKSYEIIKEENDKDGLQWFSVRIKHDKSDSDVRQVPGYGK